MNAGPLNAGQFATSPYNFTVEYFLELGVTREEALDLLKLVREETEKATNSSHHNDKQHMTALDMLRQDDQNANIITFCQAIDDMLGGGIPISKVTEICGAPGVGKTQIRYIF